MAHAERQPVDLTYMNSSQQEDAMTNAERQKRYRAKKRNAPEDETVMRNVTRVTSEDDRNGTMTIPEILNLRKQALSAERTPKPTVTPGGVSTIRTASLEDYQTNQQDYANRAKPELLNWGPWMSAPDLAKAGLRANRVAVEGDWDFEGIVTVHNFTEPAAFDKNRFKIG